MPIYKGSTKLGTIYHGGTKIGKVYKGSTLVYSGQTKIPVYDLGNSSLNLSTLGYPVPNSSLVGIPTDTEYGFTKITSISGVLGSKGSSIICGNMTFSYLDNFTDSNGFLFYRYYTSDFLEWYIFVSPYSEVNDVVPMSTNSKAVINNNNTVTVYFGESPFKTYDIGTVKKINDYVYKK